MKKTPVTETAEQWRARFAAASPKEREEMIASGLGENLIAEDLLADEEREELIARMMQENPKMSREQVERFLDSAKDDVVIKPPTSRFVSDGSDARIDAATGDIVVDGMRFKKGR